MLDPLPGTLVDGRYLVLERIGRGGFSTIYRANDIVAGMEVALKVLSPGLDNDPSTLERFRREGAMLTMLHHTHTLTAYDCGADRGRMFIVTELLRGKSLYAHLAAERRFDWVRAVRIAVAICESLAEAHLLGIVHRDLKPANIHLEHRSGQRDFVKVLDFGIAKCIRAEDSREITSLGRPVGTLEYMAPEQLQEQRVSDATDLYALGIVLYEMIAGHRPFPTAQRAAFALSDRLMIKPEPLWWRGLGPRELDTILMRCLDPVAHRRYALAEDLQADLLRIIPETTLSTSRDRATAVAC
jgi:eukaryotic-like serine/threonine-protein kinase